MTIHEDELGLRWAGASLAQIRARWADGDPVGDLCGGDRVPANRAQQVLEVLRRARVDVHYLLDVIDAAGLEEAEDELADRPCGFWPVQDVPVAGDLL